MWAPVGEDEALIPARGRQTAANDSGFPPHYDGADNEVTVGCARWLADIAAKRAILARLGPPYRVAGGSGAPFDAAVECMVQPFADHPDFDPAWRVEQP